MHPVKIINGTTEKYIFPVKHLAGLKFNMNRVNERLDSILTQDSLPTAESLNNKDRLIRLKSILDNLQIDEKDKLTKEEFEKLEE